MPISDLSNQELDQFEANYRRTKKTEGGKYSLSEILLEKNRRLFVFSAVNEHDFG